MKELVRSAIARLKISQLVNVCMRRFLQTTITTIEFPNVLRTNITNMSVTSTMFKVVISTLFDTVFSVDALIRTLSVPFEKDPPEE